MIRLYALIISFRQPLDRPSNSEVQALRHEVKVQEGLGSGLSSEEWQIAIRHVFIIYQLCSRCSICYFKSCISSVTGVDCSEQHFARWSDRMPY